MANILKSKLKKYFSHLSHSFRRIGNQIIVSLKLFYRSRITVFLFIVYPIILLLLFGSIFASQDSYSFHLEIKDNDNTSLSQNLVQKLEDVEVLDINYLTADIDPRVYLQENDLHSCLVIPQNWTRDIYATEITISNVTLIIDPTSSSARRVTQIVVKTVKDFSMSLNTSSPLININEISFHSETLSYIDYFIPGIIGVSIMNIGILGTINRQVHFRLSGLFRKLATTPITRWEYFISEIIWQFILAFISSVVIMFTAWIAFGFSWVSFVHLVLVIILVGVIVFSGIGMLISQLTINPNNTFAIGTLITLPLLFLSGVFFDISGIRTLVIISKFSPLTYIVEALRACMITANYEYAWINIAISIAIGSVTFVVGVFLTRWNREKI
ncbi:MAG: ABC transporter permease [Candidatus Heimdallarchaeota archaeon]|nr:ABC transporter permease [Candidatus Heimdallarchaeota archaeon]